MKKQIIFSLALVLPLGVLAQSAERQVIGSSGSSYSGTSIHVDYTVGETSTASGTAGTFNIQQGFQQNPANTGSGIKETGSLVSFTLYPNPAQSKLNLTLNPAEEIAIRLSISNLSGQIIEIDKHTEKVQPGYKREISLQGMSSGVYFINLYNEQEVLLRSIRFVKQ